MNNYCSKCGSSINQGEKFCRVCGTEVAVNIIQQNNQPYSTNQEFATQNQNIQPPTTNSVYSDETLIKAYIGKKAEKIMTSKFSVWAFFFGPIYLLYRKMYLYGLALWLIYVIAGIFLSEYSLTISLAGSIFLGIKFKDLYLKHVQEQVTKIKQKNPGLSYELLTLNCSKKGTENIVFVLIISAMLFLLLIYAIVSIIVYFVNNIKTENILSCESPEGNITLYYDDDNNINGYYQINIDYDLDEQKKVAKQIGMDQYIEDFSLWFSSNTSGTCQKEDRDLDEN